MKKILTAAFVFFFLSASISTSGGLPLWVINGATGSGGACTETLGSEKNVTTTCSANADASEDSSTTGWGGTSTISSDGTPQLGSYALKTVASGPGQSLYYAMTGLSLSAGTTYKIVQQASHNGTAANEGQWICGIGGGTTTRESPYLYTLDKTADASYAAKTAYFVYDTLQDYFGCAENNADNDGGIFLDNFSIKEVTNFCLGSETYSNNAAAISEVDSTTGWTASGTTTLSSSTEQADTGTHSIKFVAASDGDIGYFDFSSVLTNGVTYFISFKIMRPSGETDNLSVGFNSLSTGTGFNGARIIILSSQTTWYPAGFSFTYTTGGNFRYFKMLENGANNNAIGYIDSITVKEIQ